MATEFVLFTGNGNDGEWPRDRISFDESDCPYAFMDVVIANMFIPSHKARSHAYKNVMVDGEAEFAIHATLHEGFRGEMDMGAAYKTARLEPHKEGDYADLHRYEISDYLDRGALMMYRQKLKGKGE